MTSLKGKVAIVTGASRGIGRAIATRLADLGANVAFNYSKSVDAAKELEGELESRGVKASSKCVDIREFDAVKAWVAQVKEEFGQIDILVNNAGITTDKALMMMSKENWSDVIDTNLTGMFNASKACIVPFMKQKSGNIINISSVSGIIGLPGQTNYAATKGGMNAFTRSLAKEVAGYGVRVNAVAPGFIKTDMLSTISDEHMDVIVKEIPLNRIGSPEDVANCVEFLLSENAKYITGQILQVDGGLAIR